MLIICLVLLYIVYLLCVKNTDLCNAPNVWIDGWMDGWMDEGECKCDVVSMELVLRRDGQSRRITFVCMNDRIDKRRSRKEIIITLCADIICLHNVYAKVWIKDV